jgi:hypothetical protein
MGVRFVIADFDPGFGETKATIALAEQEEIRLVELSEPNLGDYSPIEVRPVSNFRDGLQLMHAASFDG